MDARVVDRQLRILEHRHLLRHALDRGDAVDERAAGARRLRRVEDRGAAKARQALGVPGGVRQGPDQGRYGEDEAAEQQPEEGARLRQCSSEPAAGRLGAF
jgi:hypothetical protein